MKLKFTVFAAVAMLVSNAALADAKQAQTWIDKEFQPSSLSKQQQLAEMKWFIDAAAKLKAKGVKEISVVSETIDTHVYESKTLAKLSRKSRASRCATTSSRKATWWKSCKRRCSRARASMTAGFPIPT